MVIWPLPNGEHVSVAFATVAVGSDGANLRTAHVDAAGDLQVDVLTLAPTADPHAVSTWTLTATADNAAATVTKAGEAGKSHYITGIAASFSAAAVKLLTLKDGATVIGNWFVHNTLALTFPKPIRITAGNAVELSLAASGAAGTVGAVVLMGYTI